MDYEKLVSQIDKKAIKKRNVINNVHSLIESLRSKSLLITHPPIIQDPKNKKGFLANISNAGFFTNTWKSEFTERCYSNEDVIIKGIYIENVYTGSDFDDILNRMKVKIFLICGFTSSLCMKQTVDEAARRGYNYVIINDCNATFNDFHQKIFDLQYRSKISTSGRIMAELF